MNTTFKKFPVMQLLCGVCFIVLGINVFFRARTAERLHTQVPSYRFATWMSPAQAYIASTLVLIVGTVTVVMCFSTRRGRDPTVPKA